MEGYFMFQWGASFLHGGCPMGGIGFHGGGRGLKKIIGWGGTPPTMGNPDEWVGKSL